MRKLELKDICSYLPYDLKCQGMGKWEEGEDYVDESTAKIFTMSGISTDSNEERYIEVMYGNDKDVIYFPDDFFPILHPMSDLHKPIKVSSYNEGKEFIPIVEMARIAQGSKDSSHLRLQDDTVIDFTIAYHFKQNVFWFQSLQRKKQVYILPDQDKYFDLLNQWHIDYRGLIPDGLAIDVNTIKQ